MASAQNVPIVNTPKGVRVTLGKLYLYPDGHANPTFDPVPDAAFEGLNLPLTNAVDVLVELTSLVKRMQDQSSRVARRPTAATTVSAGLPALAALPGVRVPVITEPWTWPPTPNLMSYERTQTCMVAAAELSDFERAGLWFIALGAFLVAASFLWQGSLGGLSGRPVGPGGTRADRVVYAIGLSGALLVAGGSIIVAVAALPALWVVAATVVGVVIAVWLFAARRLRIDSRKNRDNARRAVGASGAHPGLAARRDWEVLRYERQMQWRRCLTNPFISDKRAREQAVEAFGERPEPGDDNTA